MGIDRGPVGILDRSNRGGGLSRLLIGSTVAGLGAGFGLSAGRDLYRQAKANALLIMVGGLAVFGTGYALWDIARGNQRGPAAIVFRTVLLNVAVVALSVVVTVVVLGMVLQGRPATALAAVLAIQGASAVAGLVIGLRQRGPRVRAFATADANERFLRDNGLRDVGGREETMIDAFDNELKLDDIRRDAIVFRVPGRRGGRAYIKLDDTGRMIQYVAPTA